MFFRVMLFVWQVVLELFAVMRMTEDEKDLEILLLRQQLRIVERKQERGPQIPRWQKVPLAVLVVRLRDRASNTREALADSVRLFKPDTVIGWHRAIVRRKWTFKQALIFEHYGQFNRSNETVCDGRLDADVPVRLYFWAD